MQPWLRDDNTPLLTGDCDLELAYKIRQVLIGKLNGKIKQFWMEMTGAYPASVSDPKTTFYVLKRFANSIRMSPHKALGAWWLARKEWTLEQYLAEHVQHRLERKEERAQALLRREPNDSLSAKSE